MTFRRPTPRLLAAVAASAALAVGATGATALSPAAAATGSRIVVGPGADLQDALRDLRPGDTLLLRPGTYRQAAGGSGKHAGVIRPALTPATASAPITVRALDPKHRPLILAHLKLWGPSYWKISSLRIQTVEPGQDGLTMAGGTGWSVTGSEIWGARKTGAYSNVAITSDTGPGSNGTGAPRGFLFAENCVHDAANVLARSAPTDHNLYVNFQGDATSGGRIDRNVIYGSPHGAGIKLGFGGAPGARGPWGLRITDNTIADGGYQVLLHGDVRNNLVSGNLFYGATQKFTKLPKTTSVYLHDVVGTKNVFTHNYAYASSMVLYGKNAVAGGDNALRPNPVLNTRNSCAGYQPTAAKAKAYGQRGTNRWPRW